MELKIAVVKIDKHASGKSGDTVELTERPNGGISVVLADGKINQQNHKSISTMVSHRVIDHISDGVRDGAAVRAVSSSIFAEHNGNVQANLNVLSADLQTNTIIVSRNSPVPVFLISDDQVDCLASDSEPVGIRMDIAPSIVELPIKPGLTIVVFSDGVNNAGGDNQQTLDICTIIEALMDEQEPTAKEIADFLLNRAIRLDEMRPKDDMSIVVMTVLPHTTDRIRRMNVSITLDE